MPAKPKVLHTMTWLAKGGGVDQNVYLTVRDLKDEQDIHFAVGREIHHDIFSPLGLKVFICPTLIRPISLLMDLRAIWYFYRLIRRERYDIVHTHETKAGLITRIAARLAGCPLIIYGLHGVTFNDPMSAFRKSLYVWIERLTIRCAHVVVSVSQDAIEEYRKHGILGRIRSHVVYSGIDLADFESRRAASPEDRARLRQSLGVNDSDILLINVGRFSRSKAQRFTIEAFARLKQTHPQTKLLLVGEGELQEDCRRLAASLGVDRDVIFYGFSGNMPEIMSLADMELLTSLREGLPRVAVEAYLCRVPVVAFEVEGVREIIDDGVSGFVVPQGDVQALTDKASMLIADAGLRRRFGDTGYAHASARWDHRKMIADLRSIYKETA